MLSSPKLQLTLTSVPGIKASYFLHLPVSYWTSAGSLRDKLKVKTWGTIMTGGIRGSLYVG